jgi:hypothetical protein
VNVTCVPNDDGDLLLIITNGGLRAQVVLRVEDVEPVIALLQSAVAEVVSSDESSPREGQEIV